MIPQLWCPADRGPVVKTLGLIEIVLTSTGLLILTCLPIILLDLQHEVNYIKKGHHSFGKDIILNQREDSDHPHLLNASFLCHCDCEMVSNTIKEQLKAAMEKYENKLVYTVDKVRDEKMPPGTGAERSNRPHVLCEIHVGTSHDPFQKQGLPTPVSVVVEDAIISITGFEDFKLANRASMVDAKAGKDEEFLREMGPPVDDLKDNPGKMECVRDFMTKATSEEVSDTFRSFMTMMMASAICSLLAGLFLVFASYHPRRHMLVFLFFVEWASVGLLITALVHLNKSSLCLLEYGGISQEGTEAPTSVQTSIIIISSIYLIIFKGYCIVFIVYYVDQKYKEKASQKVRKSRSKESWDWEPPEKTVRRSTLHGLTVPMPGKAVGLAVPSPKRNSGWKSGRKSGRVADTSSTSEPISSTDSMASMVTGPGKSMSVYSFKGASSSRASTSSTPTGSGPQKKHLVHGNQKVKK